MADLKISALPASTTPLAGTEVLPIVQSSTTKQVSVANLTAGRSVSVADLAVSANNVVPGTAAKGLNLTANTPQAGMTSQLLNWYEEGTWTPVLSCGTPGDLAITYSAQAGVYQRIGNRCTIGFNIVTSAFTHTTASGNVRINGLPFTANATISSNVGAISFSGFTGVGYTQMVAYVNPANTSINLFISGTGIASSIATIAQFPTGGSVILRGSVSFQI